MAKKTKFDTATVPVPAPGVMCCYHCRFAKHDPNIPLGTVASQNRFVECRHSPPSVTVLPVGIDQATGQVRVALQSKFPAMGFVEFCHQFETNPTD